jgi:hypothetical protein
MPMNKIKTVVLLSIIILQPLVSQTNLQSEDKCHFEITFGFNFLSEKDFSYGKETHIESTVIDYISKYLDKTDCYRVFGNVPSIYYSNGFRVSSNGCNEELMRQRIIENIKLNSQLKYKIVIDTLESWLVQVVDSNKFYNCGIYYDNNKLFEIDSSGNLENYRPFYSSKYFDNITGNLIFIGDKQNSAMENSTTRYVPHGSRFLHCEDFSLDFENNLRFYVPEQIQYDIYLYKKFFLDYTGIDIFISEETEDKLLFYLEDSLLPIQNRTYFNFYEDTFYYPYNVNRIQKR